MIRGLFFVQRPPPIHGVSIMNERVLADPQLRRHIWMDVLPIDYSSELSQINRFSVAKVWRWVSLLFALSMRLVKTRPQFVYFTPVPTGVGFVRDLPFIALIKFFRVLPIIHLHGRGIAERAARPVWRMLYELGLRHCTVVSASAGMRESELGRLRLPGGRHYVVPNAIDSVDIFRFVVPRERTGRPRLLFLSGTFPFKGVFVLLEAACRLRDRRIDFELEIVGSSTVEHESSIRRFVAANQLESSTRLRGALYGQDKCAAFGRADVFVHPTLNDYFPLVLLEAMQFGLPIVSTHIGAIPEMVTDGVQGYLVAPHDVDALADAIAAMLQDHSLRRKMAAASRCRYLERYTPERFSANLSAVFVAEGLIEPLTEQP
jgi:glycosyltransferase involved in cell wall biosynthesis